MPVKRRPNLRRRRDLTDGQYWDLLLGGGGDSAFASDEERREAWGWHGAELMVLNAGCRPDGWWCYEAPQPRDESQHETIQLLPLGQIDAAERAELESGWWLYDGQARRVAEAQHHGQSARAVERAYREKRAFYGIPADFRTQAERRRPQRPS